MKTFKEMIKVDIKVGDTVLGGKFKNKKIVVKSIGKNAKGDLTINGRPLMRYRIIKEFKKRFFDTKKFYDKYAKGKFGRYLLRYLDKDENTINEDLARQYVEESQLFIEASHSCYAKISSEEE